MKCKGKKTETDLLVLGFKMSIAELRQASS